MSGPVRPLVWLKGKVKSPPFPAKARVQAGYLLRRLQDGEVLGMPQSRPMPAIGTRCHELRVTDGDLGWRIVYRLDADAVIVVAVLAKKTARTPKDILATARRRLREYDNA